MPITGGFGLRFDTKTGVTRRWYLRKGDVMRWLDTDEPVEDYKEKSDDDTEAGSRRLLGSASSL